MHMSMLNLLHVSPDPDPLLSIVGLGVADIVTDEPLALVMLTITVVGPGITEIADEEMNGVVVSVSVAIALLVAVAVVVVVMIIGTGQNEGQSIDQRKAVHVINKLIVMVQCLCARDIFCMCSVK